MAFLAMANYQIIRSVPMGPGQILMNSFRSVVRGFRSSLVRQSMKNLKTSIPTIQPTTAAQ